MHEWNPNKFYQPGGDFFFPVPFLLFASLSQHCGVLDSGALFVDLDGCI